MRNPWRMQDGPDNKINRNNFPMSFQYNGTFKYGKIYPIGLIRTIPGASYQIDSTLALNFMPTSFPIQTRQRAYVHFFYGRDRNFWKDYKDFVNGMNPDLVKPYLDESITQARTGNLLDYLGVPTTLVGSYGAVFESVGTIVGSEGRIPFILNTVNGVTYTQEDINLSSYSATVSYISEFNPVGKTLDLSSSNLSTEDSQNAQAFVYELDDVLDSITSLPSRLRQIRFTLSRLNGVETSGTTLNEFLNTSFDNIIPQNLPYLEVSPQLNLVKGAHASYGLYNVVGLDDNNVMKFVIPASYYDQSTGLHVDLSDANFEGVTKLVMLIFSRNAVAWIGTGYDYTRTARVKSIDFDDYTLITSSRGWSNRLAFSPVDISIPSISSSLDSHIVQDIDDNTSPYWRSGATTDLRNRIKLNAIPCRMYETIYNLYYRNPQNNPYILNGKPEYNVFIPTKDGGVDNNLYELRYRNWEDDFLTTAVQTPQQGIAPLVGLTDRGATVTLTNEDGSVTRYKTNLDENGNVTGIETTDSSEPLLTQALIDAVSYGISIEDLRNVNALQKWLELNLRKGYQYKDIIEARWGISISYNELDLPEFIGGFTQEVGLQSVTQTSSHGEGIEGALGWQAGRMYAAGSGRSITHYCEEEGYIMALLTIVPVPNYSQLLPKHWFTRDLLDSYQPEFNHIGFQPITYKEVCPIQAYQESTENVDVLEQTFGYQRPWYEYFNQVDEVHGQFRTTFKDFLINRTFDVKPELSESFLLVDPNQVNDVFAVTTDDDKILGAINHRIVAKLPISLYAQARLE